MYQDDLECVNGPEGCEGEVQYRSPSGKSKPLPRCDKHFDERCEREKAILELESDVPPDDFDPLDAGESWNEDDW